jgi:hypothetical protein
MLALAWDSISNTASIIFTEQQINPGSVASSDYASAGFIYRNQNTGGADIHLKSSAVSAS